MVREEGVVVAVSGRVARVRMRPGAECGRCCACSALGGPERELEAETGLAPPVGSRVVVEIEAGSPWLSSFLLFVLPLLGLIVGVAVGWQWPPFGLGRDAAALALGFGLLALLFALAMVIDRRYVRPGQKPPEIVEVLGP
ncbi:MAG: SoxR reducing system RseC family protein [Planctomycetes bacterium]|nr:SoxR reducing system RseC family protein [Planctomycetota bacterium]